MSVTTEPSAQLAAERYWTAGPTGAPISFSFLFGALWRQRSVIAATVAVGLVLTLVVILMVPPRYTATASILLDTRQPRVLGADAVVPNHADDTFVIENQLEILRSPRIARRAISQLKAREKNARVASASTEFEATWFADVLQKSFASNRTNFAAVHKTDEGEIQASEVEKFLRGLSIERKGRSFVVDVSYVTDDPQQSALIANAIVDAYVIDQLETKFQTTRTANLWLKERLQDVGRELENLEKRRQLFRTDKDIVDVGASTLLQKEISEQVQQLIAARATAAEAEARLSQVQGLAATPTQLLSLDLALQSTVVSEYRRQQAEIQRKIGEATSIYGEHHPTVAGLTAQLDSLNREVEQEVKRIIDNRQLASEAANEKLKLLEADLEKLKKNVLQFDEDQIKLAQYQREVSVSSELYSSLLRRYKETSAQENLQSADASIVSPATPPAGPSHPKRALIVLLGSVIWLGIGSGLGLVRDVKYRRLRSQADVERTLGLECVAMLPILKRTPANADEGSPQGPHESTCRMRSDDRYGTFSQAIFRMMKWARSCSAKKSTVIMVVAANRSEGCSTVAAQLALFAGKVGIRTALIDADLRSCSLSASLAVAGGNTLPEAILGQVDLKSAVVPLADTGIHFSPARHVSQPLDVLAARGTAKFFAALRHKFELIVVDTAPAGDYVDASALIEYVDCVLVVVAANKTRVSAVSDVVRRFGADARAVVGVVLNKVEPASRLTSRTRRAAAKRSSDPA